MATHAEASPAQQTPLGEYIFRRILDQGIQHIFGVPGDFNLNLLDHIDSVEGLSWVGTRNELNGAYAADGYARTKGLPGVVITTYGVGELSAINGIGGAMSEGVPIIHIVGTTSRSAQKNCLMLHHTLGENRDHNIFRKISEPISAATAFLPDDATFTTEVDRVIETCFQVRLPVYLYVPLDTADILVDAARLSQPLNLWPDSSKETTMEIVDSIVKRLESAQRPCFLVDLFTQRFGITKEVQELIKPLNIPGYVTPLGKSILDENDENFGGLYMGAVTTKKDVKEAIESADLVVHVGRCPSDTNCGGFTHKLAEKGTLVGLHPKYVFIGDKRCDEVSLVPVILELAEQVRAQKPTIQSPGWWRRNSAPAQSLGPFQGPLQQRNFWSHFQPYLRENDCIVAEVGTSQFGTLDLTLPKGSQYYTQIFYSSIGFTVGAALGTLVAQREEGTGGRCLLFVGDGSLQMAVQEISTMIHNNFKPTIFVINNAGYTVKRVIHAPTRAYNDIDPWNYQLML
ncbi:pyruvate decarboxylase [Tothia fuscella]|uniref:Pyruvate decarboxylase n=1 Tax=Tothia fuscella TaxID=1048955 RepID=A0A9P4NR03_9PEZI|nr:pyruvate decarboxylase [Tothia fuscella]